MGASVVVILLPTKEFVFAPKVGDMTGHKYLQLLVENEANHRAHLADALTKRGIPFIDGAQLLRSADVQPYFENADGHPNPKGHQIIAKALKALIGPCGPECASACCFCRARDQATSP